MLRKKRPQKRSLNRPRTSRGSKSLYPKSYAVWSTNSSFFFASLHNWMKFLSERAPPLFFLMMAAGPCLSILYSKTEGA